MTTAKIGPVDLDNPHLTDDKTDTDNNEVFTVVCENYKAKQIMGFAEEIKDEKHGQLSITSTNNPWGIVPIDGSNYLADNDDFTHRGYYLIKKATPSFMNSDFSSLNLELKKLANFKEYLTMDYRPHTDTDTLIDTNYNITVKNYRFQDAFDTFDTTTKWYNTQTKDMTGGSISASSGKLTFSGAATNENKIGKVWTQAMNTYSTPFTAEFDMEWTSRPASGHPSHQIHYFLTPQRYITDYNWNDVIIVVMDVRDTNTYYAVWNVTANGTWTSLVPYTIENAYVHKWKVELDSSGFMTMYLDAGGGYVQKYYGPTSLSKYNGLYGGFSFHNWCNVSRTTKTSFIDIYNNDAMTFDNIITLPVTSGLDTAATFTRTGAEGTIPCYVNPTSDLDFTTISNDYYKGSVKAYNSNNANNEARLMTNLDEVLDPTKFYMHNGLIKLETTSNSVKYHYWNGTAWTLLNEFVLGTINVLKPLYISPEVIKMQINKTKWTLQRGKQTVKVEHPNTDLTLNTLKAVYDHDGVTASNPGANADISMLTQYYCNIYGVDNLVPVNVATGTDALGNTTGYSQLNSGIISSSTDWADNGTKSLKCVTPGSVVAEGTQIPLSGLTIGQAYTYQVKVKAPAGAIMSANMANGMTSFTGTGQTQTITVNCTATSTTHTPQVRTNTSAQAITFYMDSVVIVPGTTIPNGTMNMTTGDIEERFRMQILQANTTTIKSNKIPAAEITGIGWYDNNEGSGSYNHYLNIAKEFFRQPVQKIGIKRV